MALLTKKYLSVPASSAVVERMFSIADHIFSLKKVSIQITLMTEPTQFQGSFHRSQDSLQLFNDYFETWHNYFYSTSTRLNIYMYAEPLDERGAAASLYVKTKNKF